VPGRQRPPATPPGAHFLLPRVAADIVRAARVGDGDLVFDLGAGLGALTAPLAATGARVVAVERHPGYARSLARRFDGRTGVRVVAGDLLTVPLPRRAFRVVANIPFATTAALLRRLLAAGAPPLARADLVVEYGVARRLTGPPRDGQARWWAARYDARIARRLPAACFDPPPRVDAALVTITRYPMSLEAERRLARLLAEADRHPDRAARKIVPAGPAVLRGAGIEPSQPAGSVTPVCWRTLVMRWGHGAMGGGGTR
jgi:23S rRNA (adenine-N6)-dimethyltransferase